MNTKTHLYENSLISAGFSREQAIIYEILLKEGSLTARDIYRKSGDIKRGLVYKTLDRLIDMKLVERRDDEGEVSLFTPLHPFALKSRLETEKQQTENSLAIVNDIFGQISSDYNLAIGKPGVRFFEGEAGIKAIYDDILESESDILLVRSPYEFKTFPVLIQEFIKKRVGKGMRVDAITPITPEANRDTELDKKILYSRTWTSNYDEPIEIDIYGDKVAFLDFRGAGGSVSGVIIENRNIANALKCLFRLMKIGAEVNVMRENSENNSDVSL